MDIDEFDFDQDLLTIQCPQCSTIGDIREILHKDPDGSEDLNRVICIGPEHFGQGGATAFACTNCNWTF